MKKTLPFIVLLSLLYSLANAVRIYVPGTYSTIQLAINNAVSGDTIIVQPGIYYENINYRGKNVLLTSNYLFSSNYTDVLSTIIDGSLPVHADSASVVLFINNEDSTAVLNGFTIRNGNGTAWLDEHSSGTYREGGGILTALSGPTISNNLIIYNKATDHIGLSGAGGGGIRSGDGNPKIINNVIMFNKGEYGAGVVSNYNGGWIYNNIIAYNIGGDSYGGGGLWINGSNTHPLLVNNNTIVANHSNLGGGGVRIYSGAVAYIRNNIIWANTSVQATPQIQGTTHITYNDVEGGFNGIGNIKLYPMFKNDSLLLLSNSPNIDKGDSSIIYNDIENISNPGNALYPSLGSLRNDMGVYGGPFAKRMIPFTGIDSLVMSTIINFTSTAPPDSVIFNFITSNKGTKTAFIDSIKFVNNTNNQVWSVTTFPIATPPLDKDTIVLWWKPFQNVSLSATMLVYHKDPKLTNPFSVTLNGTNIGINEIHKNDRNILIYPNPSNGIVHVSFQNIFYMPKSISILDICGLKVKDLNNLSVVKNNIVFDLHDLKAGIYYLKSSFDDGRIEYQKFIIW
jgi:hypothetical protein